METGRSLGINGITMLVGAEGVGHDGRIHSAHFFELADQPQEVVMALNEEEANQLFALLEKEGVHCFYVKSPVEFGVLGEPDQ